jgi:hypothetical protein
VTAATEASGSQTTLDAALAPRNSPSLSRREPPFEVTPDLLMRGNSIGLFPMVEVRDDNQRLSKGLLMLIRRRDESVCATRIDNQPSRWYPLKLPYSD